MTRDEHIARHKQLHENLDELLADWMRNHPRSTPSEEFGEGFWKFVQWSKEQTENPTEARHADPS